MDKETQLKNRINRNFEDYKETIDLNRRTSLLISLQIGGMPGKKGDESIANMR